jgi:hypothetical protein
VQSGVDTVISLNTPGTGGAEMHIALASFIATDLAKYDFIL